MTIGCLVYSQQDQIDFTGPFEILSRIPGATVHVIAKSREPIRDVMGLILTPEMTIAEASPLDVLVVSGGFGQQSLMADEEVLTFLQRQAHSDGYLFSVCTGALLCGAAGILRGRRATTHWSVWDLLPYYGAIPVKSRVVVDGKLITCAGVTAGLDGALTVAAILRGQRIAERIQLEVEYAPDPPLRSGTPESAMPEVMEAWLALHEPVRKARGAEAKKHALTLGIAVTTEMLSPQIADGRETLMSSVHSLLQSAYNAFNRRDVDGALALMTEDVRWPRASEGGEIVGKEEVRAYWTRQWQEFDGKVEPLEMRDGTEGKVRVRVHQVVRGVRGNLLWDGEVVHIFTVQNGLICAMDLGEDDRQEAGPTAAFQHQS